LIRHPAILVVASLGHIGPLSAAFSGTKPSVATMARRKPKRSANHRYRQQAPAGDADIRIIGGEFRGRGLRYHGDPAVRPMKHRVREAIFNLISTEVAGRHAFDLFAGTGALGLEALSRGAVYATLIEKHVPTARLVEENIRTLGVEDRTTLLVTSAFLWAKRDLGIQNQETGETRQFPALGSLASIVGAAWLIFCCPPYAFYVDRQAEMLELVHRLQQASPAGSLLIVEADEGFDFGLLSSNGKPPDRGGETTKGAWAVRAYPPAVIGIWRRN
jgi:16S rRNA (guanine(966)-N(2))-methyltransferase RsmD